MLKRLAAGIVSVAMAATMLTSCDNGRYVMSYGDTDVNSGIYIYNIVSEMLNQQYMLYFKGSSNGVMEEKVDGKDMAVYLEENAMKMTKEYCAVTEKFKELGLELSADDNKSISASATNSYNSQKDMYDELGISKESIKLMLAESLMKEKIFDYYYGKDGKQEPSEDDIVKYIEDNYVRFKVITISKSTKTDDDEKEKENKEKQELADKYYKQAEGKSFDSFDEVIEDYKKYVEEQEKAESGDDSSSSNITDVTSSGDDSSSADSSSADSSSNKVGDTDSSSQTDSSSEDDHDHDDDEDSDSSTSKYPNESMINYAMYDEDTLGTENGKLLTKIKEMSQGKAEKFENDDGYYIIIKGDVSQRSKEYASDNHSTLLSEMFDKTFTETIAQWAEDLDIKVDNDSIKRYSAKSLYNKYTDYVTKNG